MCHCEFVVQIPKSEFGNQKTKDIIQDAEGKFLRTLGIHTDISYLDHEGKPVLSFIGLDSEPSFRNVAFKKIYIENRDELTEREKQVLKLIIEGRLSKEIGCILISAIKQLIPIERICCARKIF